MPGWVGAVGRRGYPPWVTALLGGTACLHNAGKWDVLVPGINTAVSAERKRRMLLKITTTST